MTINSVSHSRQIHHECALFRVMPAPVWIEDWAAVERFCDEQRVAGVDDVVGLLENDLEAIRRLVSSIEITQVNDEQLAFVGAPDRETVLGPIDAGIFTDDQLLSFLPRIDAVWHGLDQISLVASSPRVTGGDIQFEMSWAAPSLDGVTDYSQVVVLLHDISGQVASERRMTRHIKRLTQLLDMGRGMSATFDSNLIMQLLVVTTLDLINADQSLLLLVKDETVTTVIREGIVDDEPDLTYESVMEGLSGEVIRTRRGILCDDVAADPRNCGTARMHAVRLPGTAVAVAPIIRDEAILGTLTAVNGPDRPKFTEFDLSVLEALAAQAAVAMGNTAFLEELRESRDSLHEAHEKLKATQTQLLAAHKMEAIGALAAGIAHEINTPIQFVSDNTAFVRDGIVTLARIAKAQAEFIEQFESHPVLGAAVGTLRADWKQSDCDFLLEEIPDALEETLEGANRVAEIVMAMKEFAHPGSAAKETVQVNRVVRTATAVSKNEWKYVAEVELDLAEDLPPIEGFTGPLGQSLLILLVNAAQAMAEHRDVTTAGKGTIRVTTSHTTEHVEIRVADNGPGIPDHIKGRIFEPFFTTKEVGAGSGQGLSIAHSMIVDQHQGTITVEDAKPGAVFVIHLPI
jgi:signal transduction histidine kinase